MAKTESTLNGLAPVFFRSFGTNFSAPIIAALLSHLLLFSTVSSAHAQQTAPPLESEVSESLGVQLTKCDRAVLLAAEHDKIAWCGETNDPGYNMTNAEQWPQERSVHAGLIRWLCLNYARTGIGPTGIEVHGARIVDKLDLASIKIPFRLALDQCYVDEIMNLRSAQIEDLEFTNSHIHGLEAEHLHVAGSADFDYGFVSDGQINLVAAQIDAFLSFDGAKIHDILADDFHVSESLYFRDGFVATGEIRIPRAVIERNFECRGGKFLNARGGSISAEEVTVGGDVRLDRDDRLTNNFVAAGEVSLTGSQIGGSIYLNNAQFEHGSVLDLRGATIKDSFVWSACDQASPTNVILDLGDASIGSIADSSASWPSFGNLYLDGCRYRHFAEGPTDARDRLVWIHRQRAVFTDSYQELARVLSDGGNPAGARDVLINLEVDRRFAEKPNLFGRLWNWLLYRTVRYGYEPWRALYPAITIVALGCFFSGKGFVIALSLLRIKTHFSPSNYPNTIEPLSTIPAFVL